MRGIDRRRLLTTFGAGLTALAGCSRPAGLSAPTANAAEVELPYRSEDPSKNVDRPRAISVWNADDRARHLRVTVSEDDTRLFRRGFSLSPGERIRSEPLVAKKGYYELRVTTPVGSTAGFDWQIGRWRFAAGIIVRPDGSIEMAQEVA
jgi:hypothetical protein